MSPHRLARASRESGRRAHTLPATRLVLDPSRHPDIFERILSSLERRDVLNVREAFPELTELADRRVVEHIVLTIRSFDQSAGIGLHHGTIPKLHAFRVGDAPPPELANTQVVDLYRLLPGTDLSKWTTLADSLTNLRMVRYYSCPGEGDLDRIPLHVDTLVAFTDLCYRRFEDDWPWVIEQRLPQCEGVTKLIVNVQSRGSSWYREAIGASWDGDSTYPSTLREVVLLFDLDRTGWRYPVSDDLENGEFIAVLNQISRLVSATHLVRNLGHVKYTLVGVTEFKRPKWPPPAPDDVRHRLLAAIEDGVRTAMRDQGISMANAEITRAVREAITFVSTKEYRDSIDPTDWELQTNVKYDTVSPTPDMLLPIEPFHMCTHKKRFRLSLASVWQTLLRLSLGGCFGRSAKYVEDNHDRGWWRTEPDGDSMHVPDLPELRPAQHSFASHVLDPAAFPNILDGVTAALDRPSLLALRLTSAALRDAADRRLVSHVAFDARRAEFSTTTRRLIPGLGSRYGVWNAEAPAPQRLQQIETLDLHGLAVDEFDYEGDARPFDPAFNLIRLEEQAKQFSRLRTLRYCVNEAGPFSMPLRAETVVVFTTLVRRGAGGDVYSLTPRAPVSPGTRRLVLTVHCNHDFADHHNLYNAAEYPDSLDEVVVHLSSRWRKRRYRLSLYSPVPRDDAPILLRVLVRNMFGAAHFCRRLRTMPVKYTIVGVEEFVGADRPERVREDESAEPRVEGVQGVPDVDGAGPEAASGSGTSASGSGTPVPPGPRARRSRRDRDRAERPDPAKTRRTVLAILEQRVREEMAAAGLSMVDDEIRRVVAESVEFVSKEEYKTRVSRHTYALETREHYKPIEDPGHPIYVWHWMGRTDDESDTDDDDESESEMTRDDDEDEGGDGDGDENDNVIFPPVTIAGPSPLVALYS